MGYYPPQTYPDACDDTGQFTPECLFCFFSQRDAQCTIELPDPTDERPCSTGGGAGKGQLPHTGGTIRPLSFDIFGNKDDFRANDGIVGLTRYYLRTFRWQVDPSFPIEILGCFMARGWLCRVNIDHANGVGWQIVCTSVLKSSRQIEAQKDLRTMPEISLDPRQVIFVHLVFDDPGRRTPCFTLTDQRCFTSGPPSTRDFWEHLQPFEAPLNAVTRLFIDFNMRISTDFDALPRKEPDCVVIANDALAEVKHHVDRLDAFNLTQKANYNSFSLNRWGGTKSFFGDEVIHRGGDAAGEPWTVFVRPYGYDCSFPADLLLLSISIDLFLSIEVGADFVGLPLAQTIRAIAKFECRLSLGLKLRDGFQDIDCPIGFSNPDNPRDLTLSDSSKFAVLAADGCTHVPLDVIWRGLIGPVPYSRREAPFIQRFFQIQCCSSLFAIDGLVIPGEVNRIMDHEGPQLFEGDVVIMTQDSAESICL